MNASPPPLTGLENVFSNIIKIAIGGAGIVFFFMIIAGGIAFLTSSGEQGKIEGAKKTLTYAIAGIVFIAVSYLILRFIAEFTGVQSILNFKISQP